MQLCVLLGLELISYIFSKFHVSGRHFANDSHTKYPIYMRVNAIHINRVNIMTSGRIPIISYMPLF